ncbi:RagB/SusD family nutrient uptake outer membrane protein [Formosa sediminum]|uniref:RagB/SusD family nutrient uptake outer membrane protein n=1 Tax=Formosa sediminum TaxID=2594004 RepID=A0A516GQH9_9FLAO|nr:RagB/SusD family nutrient uptake outer membrane protein [Formosa sediminum]QDO93781.1 RagB/SusD family nutrient uptake outer membrane protein [Formosa sediminum]
MRNITYIYKIVTIVTLMFTIGSCTTEDLDPSLEQNKSVEDGINSINNISGLMLGAYEYLTESGYYGRDYIINNEVRTDNCFSNGNSGRFTTEASFAYNANTGFFYDEAYEAISIANVIIAQDITALATDDSELEEGYHLQGEAYALRALVHFDLLKQYGQMNTGGTLGIPYVTEYKGDDLYPSRDTYESNVTSIMADLQTAFDMMSDNYYDSSKITMSKYTAKAIESRVAIYFEMWSDAIAASEAVINSGLYSIISADNYVSSWSAGSQSNSIFELAYTSSDNLGSNSLGFIYRLGDSGSYGDVQVLDEVIEIFEEGDVRADILGYEGIMLRNLYKYPDINGSDNIPLVRYEEIILNYAEALYETNGGGLEQINSIRTNRGLGSLSTITKDIILDERRKELMFEGFRFDDLMRTGQDIEKTSLQQNFTSTISYGDYRLAYPIPQNDIDTNANMVQNDGY